MEIPHYWFYTRINWTFRCEDIYLRRIRQRRIKQSDFISCKHQSAKCFDPIESSQIWMLGYNDRKFKYIRLRLHDKRYYLDRILLVNHRFLENQLLSILSVHATTLNWFRDLDRKLRSLLRIKNKPLSKKNWDFCYVYHDNDLIEIMLYFEGVQFLDVNFLFLVSNRFISKTFKLFWGIIARVI